MSAIDLALIGAGGAALCALIFGPFRRAPLWRATITPLASIIGSGFLVLGPIMVHALGNYAAAGMAALCLVAWGFGMAMRDNIRFAEGGAAGDHLLTALGTASDIALAGAYFISVAYYLNLFGAFALSLLPITAPWAAPIVTSLTLLALLAVGWLKGFAALERVEMVTVGSSSS